MSMQMDRRFMFMETFSPQGVVSSCPGAVILLYDYNVQTSSLKPHGRSKPNFIGRRIESLYKWLR